MKRTSADLFEAVGHIPPLGEVECWARSLECRQPTGLQIKSVASSNGCSHYVLMVVETLGDALAVGCALRRDAHGESARA